jgi:hypothetical protein
MTEQANKTTQTNKDRNYYRMLTNNELIATAKERLHLTELEQVLSERLLKAERELRERTG